MVLELGQFFEILNHVEKIGLKRQPKFKIFVLVIVLIQTQLFASIQPDQKA